MKFKKKVWKTLSKNDTGETNSHQSGISIIKDIARAGIFPDLTTETLNPRTEVTFKEENGKIWTFQYIYYNDRYFGKPSNQAHDEFRMTCVKDYIREKGIVAGDEIWFGINENNERIIGYDKQQNQSEDNGIIHIRKGWKVIGIK